MTPRPLPVLLAITGLCILACSGSDKDDTSSPAEEADTDTDTDTDTDADTDTDTDTDADVVKVVINEVLGKYGADAEDPVTNEDGEEADWIELYNAGTVAVDLEGWGLQDGGLDAPWQIDVSVVLEPGGHILVLADDGETSTEEALHVAFKISGDGEEITLHDPSGDEVDGADFPGYASKEEEGRSYARVPDGGSWSDGLVDPTPGSSNE